ncbi:MAG: AMP-binding protein [Deltaproteobacteria bacterium]|nr:MAG: AMP-binding protein [Deltaproteobacteria bacterium]
MNRLANALLDTGIKTGDIVMTFMRNSIEWMEAYFGIIRAGAVVAPLNFRFAREDIKYAADVTGASLLILEEDLLEVVNEIRSALPTIKHYVGTGISNRVAVQNYDEFIASYPASEPATQISDDDNLGIYFTSGTTGTPKAVLLTHQNLFMVAIENFIAFPPVPGGNYVAILPLYHMAAFFQWLPYLFRGGTCTLLQEFSPHDFLHTMAAEKGTEAFLVMPMLVDIVEAQTRGDINIANYDLSEWQQLNTGSQAYPKDLLLTVAKLFPNVKVNHGYGLSEGGGAATIVLEPGDIIRKCGSIGKPVAAMVEAKIVDDKGKELPAGKTGELIIKTDRMMKEYYRNPEETAKVIRDGWLYTGDLAKIDKDGYYYLVDRKKDIIISGGENVYPTEVEEVILKHPIILEAAVIGVPDERFGERVMAVVKLKPNQEMTKAEFLSWTKDRLPGYKRPRQVEFGDIPRGATRKILKPVLRKRYGGKKETAF